MQMDWDKESKFRKASLRLLDRTMSKNRITEGSNNCHSSAVDSDGVVQEATRPVNLFMHQTTKGGIILLFLLSLQIPKPH